MKVRRTSRSNGIAFIFDQLLDPICNVNIVAFILIPDITCLKVAVRRNGVFRGLRILPIAPEDIWTFYP